VGSIESTCPQRTIAFNTAPTELEVSATLRLQVTFLQTKSLLLVDSQEKVTLYDTHIP
jgi:hypothetical protein